MAVQRLGEVCTLPVEDTIWLIDEAVSLQGTCAVNKFNNTQYVYSQTCVNKHLGWAAFILWSQLFILMLMVTCIIHRLALKVILPWSVLCWSTFTPADRAACAMKARCLGSNNKKYIGKDLHLCKHFYLCKMGMQSCNWISPRSQSTPPVYSISHSVWNYLFKYVASTCYLLYK